MMNRRLPANRHDVACVGGGISKQEAVWHHSKNPGRQCVCECVCVCVFLGLQECDMLCHFEVMPCTHQPAIGTIVPQQHQCSVSVGTGVIPAAGNNHRGRKRSSHVKRNKIKKTKKGSKKHPTHACTTSETTT